MVDINNQYDFGCIGSLEPLDSLCYPDINYLENIDENDLFKLTSCDALSPSLPLLDTPPETPDNHHQNETSKWSHTSSLPTSPLSDHYLLDSSVSDNALFTTPPPHTSPGATFLVTQPSTIVNSPNGKAVIPQGALVINCQPLIQPVNLNGFQVDGSSKLNCKNLDSYHTSKSNIQPKTILPCKVPINQLKVEEKEISTKQKIEARKLRNREAALNSRLKKKEYVDNLQADVQRLAKENNDLLLENALLKQKIKDLEQELCKYKAVDINGNFEPKSKKARLTFYAFIFMFCFQVSPYFISISPNLKNSTNLPGRNLLDPLPVKHLSRTLLWNTEPSSEYYRLALPGSYNSSWLSNGTVPASMLCGEHFNRTESIRLESELRDWFTRLKQEESESKRRLRNRLHSRQQAQKKLLYDSKHVPIPRLKLWMQKQKYVDYLSEEFGSETSGEEYISPFDFDSLMSMVHRRDDTFYYLSYPSKGHLMLPPISNRTDIRPRFSFLIPTFYNLSLDGQLKKFDSKNTSAVISSQLFMLQIDCQVINTKVSLINTDGQFDNKTTRKVPPRKTQSTIKNRPNPT